MTFSIVAYSEKEEAWGVAVASKFLAAASVVSWARAGAGAIATQAYARLRYGREGLDLLQGGLGVEEALARLLADDPDAEHRQVGMVGPHGQVVAHTGSECFEYAGHLLGEGFTCQGNILVGRVVLDSMAEAYRGTAGPLPERLVAALQAGDQAGGDRRGRQSAGLLVVKAGGAYGGDGDRMIDLRVDDDPDPVKCLGNLLSLHRLYFGKSDPDARLPIDGPIAAELQVILRNTGHYDGPVNGQWDATTRDAFWELVGVENLEERWSPDDHPDRIDPVALDFLRERFGK